jgi:flagellar hook-associated protein 2
VDTTTTSLQGLVTAINSANTGATASIRSTTDASGKTVQKLDITGLTSYTDPNGLLESIGVLQKGYGSQVIPAQDASYSLDNINLTSSTNTITTAIPGTTITLLKGTPTAPGVSTLTLNQDSAGIEKNVQNMVDAYNGMIDFVASNSQLDSKTFQTGPLFGDPTVQQVQSQMSNVVFNSVKGLTGQYTNLAQIGFSFDQSGHLTFDQGKLDAAVKANPTDVAALFRTMGTSTATGLNYVSSTSKTTAAGAPLAVNITQAATEGNYVAQTAQTQPVSTVEALTFNGNLFGNTSYTLNISAGSTQDQIVSQINSDSTLKNLMMASVQNGKLVLQSNKYGSVGNFTVSSNQAAASDNSGIGTAGSYTAGVDVAGTINGEAATGSGQFLTGNTGNASTEGLQIQYTGTATGAIGSITFTKGVGASISDLVGSFTDPVNGLLSATTNSLQTEITGITDNITDLQNQLAQTQDDLKAKFSAMESAIAALKNQQAQLGTFKSG